MKLESVLSGANYIAISGHVRPDGDCVGSCLGLYNYIKLNYPEKNVCVYLEEIPRKFLFLKGADKIQNQIRENSVYDLYFSLDCSGGERLGFAQDAYENAKKQCCVDHHISNDSKAQYNYVVPEASSTSELVFNLIGTDNINKDIAECLYLGLAHDTGVFQYSNVSPSTMRAAANLLETGITASKIIEDTYYERTKVQMRVLGKALMESRFFLGDRCLVFGLTLNEMRKMGATKDDLEAIVSQLRTVQGVDVAAFMYELEPAVYKVSLRSGEAVDVSKIAVHFHGGGHKKAAGFTMEGARLDIWEQVIQKIEEQMEK